jgi:hypothetical protein
MSIHLWFVRACTAHIFCLDLAYHPGIEKKKSILKLSRCIPTASSEEENIQWQSVSFRIVRRWIESRNPAIP